MLLPKVHTIAWSNFKRLQDGPAGVNLIDEKNKPSPARPLRADANRETSKSLIRISWLVNSIIEEYHISFDYQPPLASSNS